MGADGSLTFDPADRTDVARDDLAVAAQWLTTRYEAICSPVIPRAHVAALTAGPTSSTPSGNAPPIRIATVSDCAGAPILLRNVMQTIVDIACREPYGALHHRAQRMLSL